MIFLVSICEKLSPSYWIELKTNRVITRPGINFAIFLLQYIYDSNTVFDTIYFQLWQLEGFKEYKFGQNLEKS